MREQKLYSKLSKCEFCKQQVNNLVFVTSANGVGAEPAKLKTTRTWRDIFTNHKQLRGFRGLVGYYGRPVPNFNRLVHRCRASSE